MPGLAHPTLVLTWQKSNDSNPGNPAFLTTMPIEFTLHPQNRKQLYAFLHNAHLYPWFISSPFNDMMLFLQISIFLPWSQWPDAIVTSALFQGSYHFSIDYMYQLTLPTMWWVVYKHFWTLVFFQLIWYGPCVVNQIKIYSQIKKDSAFHTW